MKPCLTKEKYVRQVRFYGFLKRCWDWTFGFEDFGAFGWGIEVF